MTKDELCQAITDGEMDDHLEAIRRTVVNRHRALAIETAAELEPGDRVRIKPDCGIKPAYIRGTYWIVDRVNQKTATCNAEPGQDTRRYNRNVRVPLGVLEAAPTSAERAS